MEIADQIPYKKDGELVLLDHIPKTAERLLDLGTGDGRLIKLLRTNLSSLQEAVGLDISPTMLNMAEIISKTIIQLRLWHMTFRIHFQRI